MASSETAWASQDVRPLKYTLDKILSYIDNSYQYQCYGEQRSGHFVRAGMISS